MTDRGSIGKRFSAVEHEISDLKIGQGRTNATLDSQSEVLKHYGLVLDRISDKLSNKETDWKTLISFVGLIVVIGGAILLPIQSRIDRNFITNERLVERATVNGWSKQDQQRFEDNLKAEADRKEDKLDEILQREMRLLDEILQREMALNDKIIAVQLDGVELRLSNLEQDVKKHQSDGHPNSTIEKVEGNTRLMEDVRNVQRSRTSKFNKPVIE